jgi:hypothetical protein
MPSIHHPVFHNLDAFIEDIKQWVINLRIRRVGGVGPFGVWNLRQFPVPGQSVGSSCGWPRERFGAILNGPVGRVKSFKNVTRGKVVEPSKM